MAPTVLVWDRLNTHLSDAIRELITERARLIVFLLPAYSPDLDPVEWVWPHVERSLANFAVADAQFMAGLAPGVLGVGPGVAYTEDLSDETAATCAGFLTPATVVWLTWKRSAARRRGQLSSTTHRARRSLPVGVSGTLRWDTGASCGRA